MSFLLRRDDSLFGNACPLPRALGEFDLRRIRAGRHQRLWQVLGARTTAAGTTFAVLAPNARDVRVVGDFNDWRGEAHRMRPAGSSGVWELFVPGVGDGCRYKYEILGPDDRWRQKADPMASASECPPATASVVFTSRHRWGDARWTAARAGTAAHEQPMSIYEVHLGSWRPGLGYRELAEVLPGYVAGLGFTHVEILPVAEHVSDDHLPTGLYAPTARYGNPDDFRYLVDRLHQAGVGVVLDWTPLRFAADDWALGRFDGTPLYERDGDEPAGGSGDGHGDAGDGHGGAGDGPGDAGDGPGDAGGSLAFDHRSRRVRNFLLANALYWCSEFHIDGLRTVGDPRHRDDDAVASFLREVNSAVHCLNPGVVTVAEGTAAGGGMAPSTGSGGPGFDLRWNTGWTEDCLSYLARDPVYRRYHHGEITFSMVYAYSEHYILPISHLTGSLSAKLPGDHWRRRAGLRGFLAFMWAHPGKQLLFMGQEFAQEEEWCRLRGLRWDTADEGVRDLVRDLNSAYLRFPALWRLDSSPEGFRWIAPDAAEENIVAFLRYDADGRPMACVCNFSPVVRAEFRIGLPFPGRWNEVLNTDASPYGGSGVGNLGGVEATATPWHCCAASASLVLPPLATVWFRPGCDKVTAP
ncbi:alpha amylase C-terminal domain-containing protein [Sphaerisporangium perillae]|uniref:alpha amylase C-terminal domain-containing protein n=1 Tax=Sphaerisporangium perillae TaxID=2935860 RepID=UPI00200F2C58|nr:alpha amylase C-terminal domain-containing protein [Sphaerisporangium perillae]